MTSSQQPVASIGMPVYNGEKYISDAIESVLAQDFGDFELVIADNASTDSTYEICRSYAEKDSRIRLVRHPRNIGAAKNYNYVFHCSAGTYFNWLAHDDILGPGFLSTCIRGFETHGSSAVLVYPNFRFVDGDRNELETDSPFLHLTDARAGARFRETLDNLGLVTSVFGVFRRDALLRTRLIGSFISSDYVLLAECALLGKVLRLEGEPEFYRRFHDKNSRRANRTPTEVTAWFDPEARVDRRPKRRLSREYMRGIWALDGLALGDRLQASAHLLARRTVSRTRSEIARLLPGS
ncbi:glycosyltransferase family 2 protein [Poseidonocella sp. HB161398]|uniref:glycosyltransferase family 2 protein n=1 Tax=Poseidonocella sp. HB161398 TaxID=2320855 RepID=UPI0011092D26|nr:glycosyltransferase family 2 protein [Poseidonocella sp. HB161398]